MADHASEFAVGELHTRLRESQLFAIAWIGYPKPGVGQGRKVR